jgi:hypothetical protein
VPPGLLCHQQRSVSRRQPVLPLTRKAAACDDGDAMETSLHRCLKSHYAQAGAKYEERLGNYRIDVHNGDQLVEIQHGSLAAIRDKVARLVVDHQVLVVKPIVARKTIIRLDQPQGREVSRRLSPKQGQLLDIFDELIFFRRVFPHPQLVLDVPLVEIEETRYPGHGRRRRWRRDDHIVADQRLIAVRTRTTFRSAGDLLSLLPAELPRPWNTGDLARLLGVHRPIAQRIAYCLRHMSAAREVGKSGNARLYDFSVARVA